MAAGGRGVVTALLLYTLIVSLIPSNVDLKHADNKQQLIFYRKRSFSSLDLLYKQTNNNVKPSIGYGKYLVAMTFIYPHLYKQNRKKQRQLHAYNEQMH